MEREKETCSGEEEVLDMGRNQYLYIFVTV